MQNFVGVSSQSKQSICLTCKFSISIQTSYCRWPMTAKIRDGTDGNITKDLFAHSLPKKKERKRADGNTLTDSDSTSIRTHIENRRTGKRAGIQTHTHIHIDNTSTLIVSALHANFWISLALTRYCTVYTPCGIAWCCWFPFETKWKPIDYYYTLPFQGTEQNVNGWNGRQRFSIV